MAAPTLRSPPNPRQGLNITDAVDGGESAQSLVAALQAALNEVYARTGGTASLPANGMIATRLFLTGAKTSAGVPMTATPGAGSHGVSMNAGTSVGLVGESTSASSVTDTALFETVLPPNYVPGQPLTLTVNAQQQGAGTVTVKTINVNAYVIGNNGAHGPDLIGVSAKTITNAAADYAFTVAGATLAPGATILFKLTTVVTTSAGAANVLINSVRVS